MSSSQLLVFFDEFPNIDPEVLADRINACDAGEPDVCTVEKMDEMHGVPSEQAAAMGLKAKDLRIGTLAISLGDFKIAVLIHSCPAPNHCIDAAVLADEVKQRLREHQAFALLTLLGGEGYGAMERIVALYKTAFGLLDQGAIGVGCEESLLAYPREFLLNLESLGSEDRGALWTALREQGEPRQLFVRCLVTQVRGERWVMTAGHGLLDLPDLACRISNEAEFRDATKWFSDILDYLLEKGPVIEPGHTMGYDEKVAIEFSAPGAGQDWMKRENGVLILAREEV